MQTIDNSHQDPALDTISSAGAPRPGRAPRRRQIDPTTCDREYSAEEVEFMQALDAYKRSSGRMFPTCSEILEVLHQLGYVRSESADCSSNSAP